MNDIKKIAIMTGGGDAPGLNAVVRAATLTAINKYGLEVVGIKNGYRGLFLGESQMIELNEDNVAEIIGKGGTVLYNSNKDNLFKYPKRNKNGFVRDENGNIVYENHSQTAVDNLKKSGIDALVIVGGDGTLTSGRDYSRMGVKVIGVPKTIDNDLNSTDVTFGFDTAINRCTDAVECLRTTGEAHHRIMVLEVMGRSAGHLALHSGIAGAADVILIPEIPYDINIVAKKVKEALKSERQYAMVVVSEGVKAPDGKMSGTATDLSPDGFKFKGVGDSIATALQTIINSDRDDNGYAISETLMDIEARAVALSHVARGGSPSAGDRVLCTRYGSYAIDALMSGKDKHMVSLREGKLTTVTLEEVIPTSDMDSNFRPVKPDDELVTMARTIGISFGDK
ncbi:MAG: ATP-dependent 6-phosphofructokinase [Clostridia bacterium]|nr:ATP-dependent 6-phosphofructokinase [Clostridia bacterium]